MRSDPDGGQLALFDTATPNLSEDLPAVDAVNASYLVVFMSSNVGGNGGHWLNGLVVDASTEPATVNAVAPGLFTPAFDPPSQGNHAVGAGYDPDTGAGLFLVAWEDHDPNGGLANTLIRARLITAAGAAGGPVVNIAAPDPDNPVHSLPAVAFDGTSFLVVWHEFNDWGSLINGRFVDARTGAPGAPFIISSLHRWQAGMTVDVAFAGEQYLVLWEDWWDANIYGIRFTPDRAFSDPDPIPIAATDELESNPSVTQVGGDVQSYRGQSFFVAWSQSSPTGLWDVYGTFVPEMVTPVLPPVERPLAVVVQAPSDTTAAPDSPLTLGFLVANDGEHKDAYHFGLLQTETWPAAVLTCVETVEPATGELVLVEVQVPPDVAEGDSNLFTLVATSVLDPTVAGLSQVEAVIGDSPLPPASITCDSWTFERVDTTGDVGEHVSLVLEAEDPHIVYYDRTNTALKYTYRNETGWHSEIVDNVGDVGLYGSLVLNGSGNPYVSYYDNSVGDLKYAHWDGASWQIEVVDSTGNVGTFTSIELDAQGDPHISYRDHTNRKLKYARKIESAWEFATLDDASDETILELDANDFPHIVYSEGLEVRYARWDGTTWTIEPVVSEGLGGKAFVLDAQGDPHIAYPNNFHRVRYVSKTGDTWNPVESVDDGGDATSHLALALDEFGRPYVCYADTTDTLNYAFKQDPAWQIEIIDKPVGAAWYVSLALASEMPVVAYHSEGASDDLLVTSCGSEGTNVALALSIPAKLDLLPNTLNPFGVRTTLRYELPVPNRVNLSIYDVTGRLVRVLVDGRLQDAGRHSVVWDGRDARGRRVASGVYFSRMEADRFSKTLRVVHLR